MTPHSEVVHEWEASYAVEYQWATKEAVTLTGHQVEHSGWERLEYFDTEAAAREGITKYQSEYRYLRVVKL